MFSDALPEPLSKFPQGDGQQHLALEAMVSKIGTLSTVTCSMPSVFQDTAVASVIIFYHIQSEIFLQIKAFGKLMEKAITGKK